MSKPLYITTTLPYVNADPHIGFALEIVQADIIARYAALRGREVFFNTGTDEHGQKIYQKATEAGKSPKDYTDVYAARFRSLKEKLELSEDLHFIRTTDEHHVQAAQELWRRCAAAGDIYKKKYKGLYCVGDEAFVKESELIDGKCPNHPSMDVVEIEEENYFFKLSAYQEKLMAYLDTSGVIVPEWRREEALNFVKAGLEDFSISRVSQKMPWGVPVPGDESQVMYVWFDALTNYISTLGWPNEDGDFKKFWVDGETLQMAGKDQVRFQSIMWQAMLMSAGIKSTDAVVYHGFITSGGQKMSKSLGNVIDPIAIVDEYGADALRYFLARHISPFEDSDFTMERFKELYNADLANGLGNLAARVMTMATKNIPNPIEISQNKSGPDTDVAAAMDSFELNKALDSTWERIGHNDALIAQKKPFSLIKSEKENERKEAIEILEKLVRELHAIAIEIEPVMPNTSRLIQDAVREHKKPENLFPRKE